MDAIHERGLPIGIASNFDQRLHSVCNALPELAPLTRRVVSTEVGFSKPSRHFYSAIADALECEMEEVLMVGDGRVNDFEGAMRHGMPALWLDRSGVESGDRIIHSLTETLNYCH